MQENASGTPPTEGTTTTTEITTGTTTRGGRLAGLGRLLRRRAVIGGLVAVVALAVVAGSITLATLRHTVTLAVDGQDREVTSTAGTVGELLDEEGLTVGERDIVAPGPDEELTEGSEVTVRYARPFDVTVDGDEQTHWVTATSVSSALAEIGTVYDDSRLSTSRGASIGRGGASLNVVTPKKLTIALAGKKPVKRTMTVLTVADALKRLDVKVDKRDTVSPKPKASVEDGDKIVFTDVRVVQRRDKSVAVPHGTVRRNDPSALVGTTEVTRQGSDGVRDLTWKVTLRNGKEVDRKVVRRTVVRQPEATVISVGTKQPAPEPEPAPAPSSSSSSGSSGSSSPAPEPAPEPAAPNYASGSTVWDQLAQCESGGNWAINTGNGYYGGLQFNVGTWQGYGGSGLPSQASREEQIRIATKVRDARGGYGAWPACSQSLGLPQ